MLAGAAILGGSSCWFSMVGSRSCLSFLWFCGAASDLSYLSYGKTCLEKILIIRNMCHGISKFTLVWVDSAIEFFCNV